MECRGCVNPAGGMSGGFGGEHRVIDTGFPSQVCRETRQTDLPGGVSTAFDR
jgi:hypothetical protein